MRIPLFTWLFLIPVVAIFFGTEDVFVSGQCQSDQQWLLLQLKNSLSFNSSESVNLVKWSQNTDCCSWPGVRCDAGGRVIELDLTNKTISRGIDDSSSLFSLQHLQRLNLAYNRLNSPIPSGFGNLSALSYLNLSNAGFTGQIPIEFSRMRNLVGLDLSANGFLSSSILKLENPNLQMLVQNLTGLKQLRLDGVIISVQGKEWCQALSSSLPDLEELSMSNCDLSGPIDSSLAKLQSLSVIRLDKNNLSAPVPDFFAEFPNLTSLQLSYSNLNGIFPRDIFHLNKLKTLDLSGNELLQGSLEELSPNASLETLLLSDTSFKGMLPDSIGNLRSLSRIELARCSFSGEIPKTVANLTQLVSLDFSFNNFSGSLPSFSSSKYLRQLNLAHNRLNGSIHSTNWSALSNLVSIDLRNNSFNGTLPASLFGISSLQRIHLLQNQFSGELSYPSKLASSVLDTLDLGMNKLHGPFPDFVFGLHSLKILILSSNNFSGPLQLSSFQQLQNLSALDLSYNSLSIDAKATDPTSFPQITTLKLASCNLTTFPGFLKNQSRLTSLDLSDNQIVGEIPSWVWEIGNLLLLNASQNFLRKIGGTLSPNVNSTLGILDLHANQLEGSPVFPPLATYLDYSYNNFSSVLPEDIGDYLNFTYFFSLSSNRFSGSIPKSICNAAYLHVLDLSNNSLGGEIPDCLVSMNENLGVLNLRENELSGNISDKFPSSCALQTLDLNRNKLQGMIPRSLVNCTMLEVLDLGNNQFSDIFPCHLKTISSFRVLVLRSNKFYGEIGCGKENFTWPRLQIVDLAHNNFSGRLPSNCLQTWTAMKDDEDDINHLQFPFLPLSSLYYQDAITVTVKGLEMELLKILSVFTSIDLSCNNFDGPIPTKMGDLKALYLLNLSHNSLTGNIPPALGDLGRLESLDLSCNNLSGEIPQQLAHLNFLSFLNLSYNQLMGSIPIGNQLQTFSSDSFEGNKGLCGCPLTKKCSNVNDSPPASEVAEEFDWQFIFTGLGFGIGAAAFVAPILFWKRASNWVDDSVEKILPVILPMVNMIYTSSSNAEVDEEEDLEHDNTEGSDNDVDVTEEKDEEFRGRYCVFCSKLDITRKMAIHDPKCTCHGSPSASSSSSSSSSSFSP